MLRAVGIICPWANFGSESSDGSWVGHVLACSPVGEHKDHRDSGHDHTRCQKTLRYCGHSSEDCEGAIREWLLAGTAFGAHDDNGRTAHRLTHPYDLVMRPRDVQDAALPLRAPKPKRRRGNAADAEAVDVD
jgi:hypothetical protein